MTPPDPLRERLAALIETWKRRFDDICRTRDRCDSARAHEVMRCFNELETELRAVPAAAPRVPDDDVSDAIAKAVNAYSLHFSSVAMRDEVHQAVFQSVRSLLRAVPAAAPRVEDQSEDGEVVKALTAICREADQAFERVGGSSRHWVRDCFLPLLNKAGWAMTRDAAAPRAEDGRAVLETCSVMALREHIAILEQLHADPALIATAKAVLAERTQ